MFQSPMLMQRAQPARGVRLECATTGEGNDGNPQAERVWAEKISGILTKHYPGHLWAVHVHIDAKTKGAHIKLPILMQTAKTYAIPLNAVVTHNDLERVVVAAGGELLERFRIPRGNLDMTAFLEARQKRRLILPQDQMPT